MVKNKSIKYAYFDLDGTLLNRKKEITKQNLEALKILKRIGVKIGIATGRPEIMIKNIMNLINPDLPTISINGGLITNNQEIILNHSFSIEDTKKIYEWLCSNKIDFLAYTKNEMYFNNATNTKWFFHVKDQLRSRKLSEKWLMIDGVIPKYTKISKFLILTENLTTIVNNEIQEYFDKNNNVYLVKSQSKVLDVMPKNINKGNAISILHEKKYIDINKTIVFGDAPNDISMFKKASLSVAVPNSHEELKKKADIILVDETENYIYNFVIKQWGSY